MLYVCVRGVMDVLFSVCDAWICRCSCVGSMSVSSCICCIFASCMLLYSAGSGVNRAQVILSAFSVRVFCFIQAKTL